MRMKFPLTVLWALALAACGPDAEPPQAPAASTAANAPAANATGNESRSAAPEGARVYFITPRDGATVANPVRVEFGIEGMEVVPAGQAAPRSGHHHLLVDTQQPASDRPIPADANHIHFGDGSTSTELTLEPGEHTLQLLFADHLHIPHDPPVSSQPITITVE